jgi:signal transduction histidine kinase
MASLGQLTAGIAHELNNPVNFISGNVKPLKRDIQDILKILTEYESIVRDNNLLDNFDKVESLKRELDLSYLIEEITKLLEGIGEGALRSGNIVKGLRDFTSLDEDKFVFAHINEGLDSVLILIENKLKNNIKVHKNYGDLPRIACLPAKLNQAFLNILTNSVQAIEGEGDIHIETLSRDKGIQITFRDSGIGMTPEIKSRIFEPFYTTREVGEGMGLGLSISYGIIEQHGGKIDVDSEPGKGAEFVINLPTGKI